MTPAEENVLDRFAEALREEEPPPVDEVTVRRMIRQATHTPPAKPTRWPRATFAAAAVVLIAGSWFLGRHTAPTPQTSLASVVLPTGDRLSVSPSTEFRVDAAETESRAVSLQSGRMVVEARRGTASAGFRVETPHATVVTLGTIFSVDVSERGTRVDVYEGRVSFVRGSQRQEVASGQHAVALENPDQNIAADVPLLTEGNAAARRRLSEVSRVVKASRPAPVATLAPPDATDPALPSEASLSRSTPTARQTHGTSRPAPREATPVIPDAPPMQDEAVSLDDARHLLSEGQFTRALAAAEANDGSSAWLMVAGDALRGLHRWEDAKDTYARASTNRDGSHAAQAGYLAAWLSDRKLHNGDEALQLLTESGALDSQGVLGERSWLLRCAVLVRQGREQPARESCQQYLDRFPDGTDRAWAEEVTMPPSTEAP